MNNTPAKPYRTWAGRTPTYRSWDGIIQRCTNPKCKKYRIYGGRGIKVCERWLTYTNFLADVGERLPGTTIDRIDNDGHYEPGNCRWSTPARQSRNSSNAHLCALSAVLIRQMTLRGARQKDLVHAFGVVQASISAVIVGKVWRDAIADFGGIS